MAEQPVNILLVEDDDAYAVLKRVFESAGRPYRIVSAKSIREARHVLHNMNPDVVVADLVLPDGRATDILAAEPQLQTFPLVLMTPQGSEQAAVEALRAGASDYVVRSESSLATLPHAVERTLREWRQRAELRRLEEARSRSAAIIDATADVVMMIDPQERLIAANASARTLLGLPAKGNLPGRPLAEFLPEAAYQAIRTQGVPAAVSQGCWSGEVALVDHQNREVPVSLVLLAHKDIHGQVGFLSLVARDLTERKRLEEEAKERAVAQARLDVLSAREREVLELVIAGKANKVIARELGISMKTVEMHRARIMKKLQVDSVAELVRLAVTAENG